MNENDKILISAYLDGETSDDESKYVESLLVNSNDSNDYANNLKRANNEINSFFDSDETKKLDTNISSFIEDQKQKSNKIESQFGFLNKPKFSNGIITLVNQRVLAGAFTFAIIGILVIPSLIEQEDEFFTINIEREGYITQDGLNINKIISDTLIEMSDTNIKKANLVIGSEIISISITDKLENCISGNFLYSNDNYQFQSCLVNEVYVSKIK
jgi:hypothetical protein